MVSDIRSLPFPRHPLPLPPANLPCVHFHPRSSSPASPSPPASRHSSFLPPARTFAIGLWYQPASTYTAYSNEPEDCPMYLGRLTGFSKLKRGARVADPPKPTDPRTHDRGLWMLLFLFCVLTPIHPRSRVFFIFVNARFVIVSARARISSFGPASTRLALLSFLADYTKIVKVRHTGKHNVKDDRSLYL